MICWFRKLLDYGFVRQCEVALIGLSSPEAEIAHVVEARAAIRQTKLLLPTISNQSLNYITDHYPHAVVFIRGCRQNHGHVRWNQPHSRETDSPADSLARRLKRKISCSTPRSSLHLRAFLYLPIEKRPVCTNEVGASNVSNGINLAKTARESKTP